MALKEDLRLIALTEILVEQNIVMIDLLKRIERGQRPERPLASVIELEVFKLTENGPVRMEDMKLALNQNAEIKIKAIKDAAGNPAKVDGDKLEWTMKGDLSLGTLTPAADGMSALFVRNGAVGKVTVQVSGDADLGPDVKLIVGEVEIECLGGEAVMFELEAVAVDVVAPTPEEPTPVEPVVEG